MQNRKINKKPYSCRKLLNRWGTRCVKTSGDADVSAESAVCSYISPQSSFADFSLYKWRGSDLQVGNVQHRNYH